MGMPSSISTLIVFIVYLTPSGLAAKWGSNYLLLEINTTVAWPRLPSTSSLHSTATTNLQEHDPVRSAMMPTRIIVLPVAVRLCGLVMNHRCEQLVSSHVAVRTFFFADTLAM